MRTLLVRLETPLRRGLAVGLVLAGGLWLSYDAVRRAVADARASAPQRVEDVEGAVALNPGDPDLRLAAADARLMGLATADLDAAEAHLRAALAARPTDAGTWLRLALLRERQGRSEAAREALATAVRYDRHGAALRWEAAVLSLRLGDRERALEHFRYVIEVDPSKRDVAFAFARSLLAPDESPTALLPDAAEPLTAILRLAVRDGDLDLAKAAWERRAGLEPPLPEALQRQFLDLLLAEGEGLTARRLWGHALSGAAPDPKNAVWNGGFESPRLLGWGFDWQVKRQWGVEVRLDRRAARGEQALRLSFNAYPNFDFAGVSQLVAVEPGKTYRLEALARADDLVTQSGLKVQVVTTEGEEVLAETPAVSGTTDGWVPLATSVRIPAGVSLVRVRLRREPAATPEGNLGGRVWVDEVSLTPEGRSRT